MNETQKTTLHRPEHYVLQNPEASHVWQPTFFQNGSLHLAFSADEYLSDNMVMNMQQFKEFETVKLPTGLGIIQYAFRSSFEFSNRTFYRISYSVYLNGSRYKYDEFQLLDWDNYKDPMATDLYRSFQKYYLGGIKVETPYVEKPAAKKWCQSCTDQGIGSDWKLTREGWLCADCFYTKNEEYKETDESILTVIMDGATYYKLANKE